MPLVPNAYEMGSVVGVATTQDVDGTPSYSVGSVTGDSDPSVPETANGVTAHRLGSVYTESYEQVSR